jgi:hypothetical protein
VTCTVLLQPALHGILIAQWMTSVCTVSLEACLQSQAVTPALWAAVLPCYPTQCTHSIHMHIDGHCSPSLGGLVVWVLCSTARDIGCNLISLVATAKIGTSAGSCAAVSHNVHALTWRRARHQLHCTCTCAAYVCIDLESGLRSQSAAERYPGSKECAACVRSLQLHRLCAFQI